MAVSAKTFQVVIDHIRDETPTVKTFRFRFPEGTDFSFLPGQWAMFYFPDDSKHGRAYSIASSPIDKGYVEASIARVGDFTEHLFRLKPGKLMLMKGPYGKWFYDERIAHGVLISGGTGVAPFRSIARYVVQKKIPNRLTILSSAHSPVEILYRSELDGYSKQPNIKVIYTITESSDGRWNGLQGHWDVDKVWGIVGDPGEAHFYLCGPNELVHTLAGQLASRGIPKEQIHHEMWGDFDV